MDERVFEIEVINFNGKRNHENPSRKLASITCKIIFAFTSYLHLYLMKSIKNSVYICT